VVSMSVLYAYFVIAVFAGCPSWGKAILGATRGCPDLYKEDKTNVYFYNPLEMEARRNGRGQCAAFGTIQCWPLFKDPFYEETGEDATYYYRQWFLRSRKVWWYFRSSKSPLVPLPAF
jgi:hypothetical protein